MTRLSRQRARAILLGILLLGAVFRFQKLDWDEGHHLHPDERFISMVEEKLAFPKSPGDYFDSKKSTLNPYNRGEGSFVYGTLPLVMAKAVAPLLGKKGYGETHLVGRALSGIFDLLTVWLVYRITRRFAHRRASLLAAGLSAFCVLGIQLSHFWAVDTFLTTFTAAALLGAVRMAQDRSGIAGDALTGVAVGLAAACKITALALFAPIGIAILVRAAARGRSFPSLLRAVPRALLLTAAAAATVRVFLPHVFLGPSALSFRLDPRWIEDLRRLKALSSSVAGFPPALQWAGRTFLYPIENFVLWGAGVAFGVCGDRGRLLEPRRHRPPPRMDARAADRLRFFLFLYHGLTIVKSIRYFYPAYPALAVLTGVAFSSWMARSRRPRLARACAAARPGSDVSLGGRVHLDLPPPAHPRRGHPLDLRPRPAREGRRQRDVGRRAADADARPRPRALRRARDPALRSRLARRRWRSWSRPSPKSDWVAVTSGRVYMNVTRVPSVFPMSIAYYRALFDGRLGFERAADFTSYPSLGPLRFPDDGAEEQFTVYDHPRVLLFRKTPAFSADRTRGPAPGGDSEDTADDERLGEVAARVAAGRRARPAGPACRSRDLRLRRALERGGLGRRGVLWYLALALVGLLAAPLAWAAFPRLSDRGFGFARLLGLVLTTYLMALSRDACACCRTAGGPRWCPSSSLAVASAWAFLRDRHDFVRFVRENRRLLLQGEFVFALGFLLFLGIRALNPEIYWGEKPMDFSILNILVRTPSLPPSDPWLAGAPLGYYTFGQEMIVWLTFLTNLSTRFTFNLAFGFLGGTILQGAFSLARNWGGRLRAGVAGASLVLLVGNLSGLREWLLKKHHLDWDYFWATSRVIRDTINEYPFWSLVFADLHAHVLAIPLFLLFCAAALHLVRVHADPAAGWRTRLGAAALLGFVAACQALTNAWDVPLLGGLVLVVSLTLALMPAKLSPSSFGRAGAALAVTAATAWLAATPLWFRAGGRPGIGRNLEASSLGVDQLTVFGLFLLLALGWWLASVGERLAGRGVGRAARWIAGLLATAALAYVAVRWPDAFFLAGVLLFAAAYFLLAEEREDRLALAFLATAFFLVLFTQRFYIVDRMNTFFKLYLEAWLLFALATAVLVFRASSRRGTIDRWALPLRAAAALLAVAALFTSATAGRAAVSRHFAPYSGPSLDGLRYLEEQRPGEYRAVEWLRRNVPGTPVLLEAQGPSYQDFGRISMLTGLPTVLGWDYHVKQRGNPDSEIETRKLAVRAMYSNPDGASVEPLLRRYRVAWIYVGWLERKTYPPAGLRKFATDTGRFQLAYENPQAAVYRVAGGPAQDILEPARETLPESTATGPPTDEPEEPPSIAAKAAAGEPAYGGLKEPRGAAVDGRGRLWVADFGHSRLRVFDPDGGRLGGWGGRGSGEFGFKELCGVAIRGDDLYVADTWNGRIQAYTIEGVLRASVGSLYGPRGVAVAPDGRVWVTDTGNHRVVSYGPLLTDARIHGRKGAEPGEFSSPMGIAVSPDGEIYVADTGNRRIQVLGPDGAFRRAIPFAGWGENVEPGLAIDADGTVYATDPGSRSVVILDAAGREKARRTADESGRGFDNPTGIAIDSKRRILYVVNSGTSSISTLKLGRTP